MNIEDFNNVVNTISDKDIEKYDNFSEVPVNISNLKSHMFNANGITTKGLEADIIVVDKLVANTIRGYDVIHTSEMYDPSEPAYEYEITIYGTNILRLPFDCFCFALENDEAIGGQLIIDNYFHITNGDFIVVPRGSEIKIDSDLSTTSFVIYPIYKDVYKWLEEIIEPHIFEEENIYRVSDTGYLSVLAIGLVPYSSSKTFYSIIVTDKENNISTSFMVPVTIVDSEITTDEPYNFKWIDDEGTEHNLRLTLSGDSWSPTVEIY